MEELPGARDEALRVALSELRNSLCAGIAEVERLLATPALHGIPHAATEVLGVSPGSMLASDGPEDQGLDDGGGGSRLRAPEQSRIGLHSSSLVLSEVDGTRTGCLPAVLNESAPIQKMLPPLPSRSDRSTGGLDASEGLAGGEADSRRARRSHSFTSSMSELTLKELLTASRLSSRKKSQHSDLESSPQDRTLKGLIHHKYFDICCLVAIVTHAIFAAVEVEYMSARLGSDCPQAFTVISHLYNAVFVAELLCRIWADGPTRFYTDPDSRGWALLDTALVVLSIVDMLDAAVSSDDQVGTADVRVVRTLRSFRVVRNFRAFRLIRFMTHLNTLLVSILATLHTLVWASALMVCVIFCFAVAFTECAITGHTAVNDVDLLFSYWGSLGRSMGTLFQSIADGVSWREPYKILDGVSPFGGTLFLGYLVFAQFVLLNVITGAFCNAAIDTSNRNPELVAFAILEDDKAYGNNLLKIFRHIDTCKTGEITLAEFRNLLDDRMMRAQFQALGLDMGGAFTLFRLMDTDKNGMITEEEFVSGCRALRGGAKTADVSAMRLENRRAKRKILEKLSSVEDHLGVQRQSTRSLCTPGIDPIASTTTLHAM